MTDSDILLDMLHKEITTSTNDSKIKLKEENSYAVTIADLPSDAIIIKTDSFPAPLGCFQNTRGECKRADYILISETKKVILFIELKGNKEDGSTIIKQLKGALCVAAYFREIGKQFWDKKDFLDGYKNRFIGITEISISKRTSIVKQEKLHDSPQKFLKISSPRYLIFGQLAALLSTTPTLPRKVRKRLTSRQALRHNLT
ncbi:MAG: hypothetical protein HQL96_02395 [Magnetococcales bacterium]|nr:hypothetical protein [Magnetococcales bacterium]